MNLPNSSIITMIMVILITGKEKVIRPCSKERKKMIKNSYSKPSVERILPNMKTWEKNEINTVNHLNDTYYPYAIFMREGGSDSTVSDIHVKTYNGTEFYIECKCKKAQSGQIVIKPNSNNTGFIATIKSDNPITQTILDKINQEYATYAKLRAANITNIKVNLPQTMIIDWIKAHYQGKNASYIMIEDIMVPLDKLNEYVTVTATMRAKRSGTTDPNKTQSNNLINYIPNNIIPSNNIISLEQHGKKTIITTKQPINTDKFFTYDNNSYKFSVIKEQPNTYSIKKRSNTNNLNVIFGLALKKNHPNGMTEKQFQQILKNK